MEFSATLAVFAAIITAPLLLTIDFTAIPLAAYLLMLLSSCMGATAFLLVSKAVRHAPISVASPLFALSPLITAILAFGILGEGLSPTGLLGILMIMVGAYVLEHHRGISVEKNLKLIFRKRHVKLMFSALILYAFCGVIDRYLLSPSGVGGLNIDPVTYLPIIQVMIAVVFLILLSLFHDGLHDITHGIRNAWIPIMIVAFLTVAYRFTGLFAISMEEGKIALFIGLKRTSAFWAALVGGALFHETHLLRHLFAALVMIGGALLILI